LKESGGTALGPGLAISVSIASRVPRSEIILFTDGFSNVGVGALDTQISPEAKKAFYAKLGDYAKSREVSVSVIGIEGSDGVALQEVGAVADRSSGTVNILQVSRKHTH
jgi:Mg-chelatase subunit ChlD